MRLQEALRRIRERVWRISSTLPEHQMSSQTSQGWFSFSSKDQEIGRKLFLYRDFDFDKVQRSMQVLKQAGYLPNGDARCLVDVGANVGTVCIPLLRNGTFARALAFEPEPRNYRFLAKNIKRNGLADAIKSFNCALSSSSSVVEMELSSDNYGDHRVRMTAQSLREKEYFGEEKRRVIKVPAARLDDILQSAGLTTEDVSLVWIDVQGHEKSVLEGAMSLVQSRTPFVCEFWPYGLSRAGTSAASFAEFICQNFTAFYDFNSGPAIRYRASEIGSLFDRYSETSFTDLLLVKD